MLDVRIFPTAPAMSAAAAAFTADALGREIARRRPVRVAAATAASQIAFQAALVGAPGIDWSAIELFQLDEYIGLAADHPARFAHQLRTHLIAPAGIAHASLLDGADPAALRARLSSQLAARPLDLAILGIGENAHLAFNDPPADFTSDAPYLIVELDEACRQQQVSEGWFARLADVPRTAITMSIPEMLRAREIVVVVPDARKARAVAAALTAPVAPAVPATALRTHARVTMFLDEAAASDLDAATRQAIGARES